MSPVPMPQEPHEPQEALLDEWAAAVRSAAAAGTALQLRGGGSKAFYGGLPRGDILHTGLHAGIVDYEPSELVVTARCGTPLAQLEAALASHGQMLACEPPHFGPQATVGGMIAAGLSGPRRATAGAVRDFVLGVRIMDGRGERLSFGGRVMKNVAGYDVARLMAGSLGTLGIILEASLKTLPLPASELTVRLDMTQDQALDSLNRWAGQPLGISASAWHAGELHVRLSGAAPAVAAARARIGGDLLEAGAAATFWRGLREQTHPFFGGALPLWRFSLPPTAPADAVPGDPLIEWGGAQRWIAAQADAAHMQARAAQASGHAVLFRGGDRAAGVFAPLTGAQLAIHRRLKAGFDPAGVFNPGRLYPDL